MGDKKPSRIVAIDSMILAWGIRQRGDNEKRTMARQLFDEFAESEALVILPSIVVAEYVAQIPDQSARENTITALRKQFQIEPFDVHDAALAAQLWNYGKASRKMGKVNARVCLKADTMIVAVARNRGAREFYTEDADCFEMAKKAGMRAKGLPRIAKILPFQEETPDEAAEEEAGA